MKKETILGIVGLLLFAYGIFSSYMAIKECATGTCSIVKIYLPVSLFAVGVIFSIWAIIVATKRKKAEKLDKKEQESL